jgi:hypothetical protein
LGVLGASIAAVAGVAASVALVSGTSGSAVAATYATAPPPPPTQSVEPIPTGSASPGSAQASQAADDAADSIADNLPAGTSDADKAAIRNLLHNLADQFAAAGLNSDEQVAALQALVPMINKIAPSTLTQSQKLATIQASGDVVQVLALLDKNGSVGSLTADEISQLLSDMAATLNSSHNAGSANGAGTTVTFGSDGSVHVSVNNLQPGSDALLAISLANHKVNAAVVRQGAARRAALNADGSGTIVLTGTANDQGIASFTIPGSSLNATTADQAKAALDRAVLGFVGTAKSGASSVFSTTVGDLVRPTLTTRTPTVLWHATAVLTGTAKAGAVLQLVGRENGAPFRVLRTATADSSGRFTFSVNPSATMRFAVRSNGAPESPSIVINVRAIVTETITRTARLTYRFAGKVQPVLGAVVNVYRVSSTGSVLTAQARPTSTGTWTVTRKFSAPGTYNFFARSSITKTALAGLSSVQKVAVH